jgi:hypothetical protein
MKSNVDVVRVYKGILEDIPMYVTGLELDLSRDYERIKKLVSCRGDQVYLLDFPALLRCFDEALQSNVLSFDGAPLSGGITRKSPIPKLFRGLYLRVFETNGTLKENPCPSCILFIRQLYGVFKKFKKECKDERNREAISDFYATDVDLPEPGLQYEDPELLAAKSLRGLVLEDCGEQEVLGDLDPGRCISIAQRVFDIITQRLRVDDIEKRGSTFKHGPGAVSDRVPSGSWKYHFHRYPRRLEHCFPSADTVIHNYGEYRSLEKLDEHDSVSSKLIMVPKTAKGPRLIASEPISHQWCQQSLRFLIEERVDSTELRRSIQFRSQEANQVMALSASHDGEWATIDLSAASDRVRPSLVASYFRKWPWLVEALFASRTRYISNDIYPGFPMIHKLRKFSTMGSACTFPVQTLLFTGICVSAILVKENRYPSYHEVMRTLYRVQVFGDDIIVPNSCSDEVIKLLTFFGFRINVDKSCFTGKFRESCGVDAYDGHNVTPTYVTQFPDSRKPESLAAAFEIANNLWKQGFWRASNAYASMIPAHLQRVQKHVDSSYVGLASYAPVITTRYNNSLQREEQRIVKIRSRQSVSKVDDPSSLLQYFTEAPMPDTPWSSGIRGRARLKVSLGWGPRETVGY